MATVELTEAERAICLAALGLYRDETKDTFLPQAGANGQSRLVASWQRILERTEALIEKIEEAE